MAPESTTSVRDSLTSTNGGNDNENGENSTKSLLTSLSHQIISSINNQQFEDMSQPPWTYFSPDMTAQISTERKSLSLPEMIPHWRNLFEENPDYYMSVGECHTYLEQSSTAEVYMNVKKHGRPIGLVVPAVLKMTWNYLEKKEKWMLAHVHTVEGLGSMSGI